MIIILINYANSLMSINFNFRLKRIIYILLKIYKIILCSNKLILKYLPMKLIK